MPKNLDPFKLAMGVAILLAALSVGYYLVVFLPQQAQQQTQAKNADTASRQTQLQNCLAQAAKTYVEEVALNCKQTYGQVDSSLTCPLPTQVADRIRKEYTDNQDSCYKQFPQK